MRDGTAYGVLQMDTGELRYEPYHDFLGQIIASNDRAMLEDFTLTIGVVSNHGNWFTAEDHNKELKVLADSYDWLLFLSDAGIALRDYFRRNAAVVEGWFNVISPAGAPIGELKSRLDTLASKDWEAILQ